MVLIQLKSMDCGLKAVKFETEPQIFAKHPYKLPFTPDLGAGAPKTGKNSHLQVSNKPLDQ
jgi:hypothetical protein